MARKLPISASARLPPTGTGTGIGLAVSVRLSRPAFSPRMRRLATSRPRAIAKEAPVKYTRKSLVSGDRANAFSAASAMHKVIEITLRVAFGIILPIHARDCQRANKMGVDSGTALRVGRCPRLETTTFIHLTAALWTSRAGDNGG